MSLDAWTSGRALKSVGTNHGSAPLAFQHWHRFKEAFAPELIERAVASSAIPVRRLLDPFGGSGTSALASQFLSVYPVTVEINPYLADVIEAKVTSYDLDALSLDVESLLNKLTGLVTLSNVPDDAFLPPTFVEPGVRERWIFSEVAYGFIRALLLEIDGFEDPRHRRLFRVVLGGILVGVSNVRVSGKGRRYRAGWEARQKGPDEIARVFRAALTSAMSDLRRFNARGEPGFELLRGDARVALPEIDMTDLSVFSPPYPNSFDYTDVYNVELWTLGYLSSMAANRDLRSSTLASHVQIKREYGRAPEGSAALDSTISALESARGGLWNSSIPEMVGGYFSDLWDVVTSVKDRLNDGGHIWMVVGDSRYAGIDVPVARVLEELALKHGLRCLQNEPFREMRTSPQQGGEEALAESLVVLAKPF